MIEEILHNENFFYKKIYTSFTNITYFENLKCNSHGLVENCWAYIKLNKELKVTSVVGEAKINNRNQ